jgi:hypothetical protein
VTQQIITVSITLVVDANGTTQDFHFATRGFTSGPADTPASTKFEERIVDAGEYRRELFSGARVAGLSRPSFGSITLSNHDGALDGWMSYGVSGAPVIVRLGSYGAAFPADFTEVFRAYAKTLSVDFKSAVVAMEDRSILFDRPIATEVFQGNEAFVIGSPTKKKPIVLGRPGFVPMVLVDSGLSVYYVQSNATDVRFLGGALLAYDGGIPLTFGGHYATPTEGVTVAPAPGHFRVWADNGTASPASPTGPYPNSVGPCYVRLGSPPQFDVRFDPLGLYLESQSAPIRWWTFPDLVRRAGATDVTAATLAPGSYPATVGSYYIDGDQTYADIMSDSAKTSFAAFGFDRLDRFFTFDLRDPDADAGEAIAYTFTTSNARNFERRAVPGQEKPVRQVNVSAGRTWPGSVANGATPEAREQFTREPWQLQFAATSDAVLRAHPGAIAVDVEMEGRFEASDADKLNWGRKYIELYGGLRELITLECTQFDATTIGIELGAKVQIRMPRFLCASGRNFRVVTQTINLRARTVSFGLWGGSAGPSDAVLGGGTAPAQPTLVTDYFLTRIPHPDLFAAIAVEDVLMVALGPTPAPVMSCIVEGGSPLAGPGGLVDDWSPAGDPHWSNVIYLNTYEGPDGGLPSVVSPDLSDYNQTQGGTASAVLSVTSPIEGATSVDFNNGSGRGFVLYYPGAESIIGTQDWTWESVVDFAATQNYTAPAICRLGADKASNWAAGHAVLHFDHPSYPVVLSFWVYNFSTTTPLLVGSTSLIGLGPSHVGWCRIGSTWNLLLRGAIEDTATWSGSVNSAALVRGVGGNNDSSADSITGLLDMARETVGVGRYSGPYNPPYGGASGPSGDPLTPLTILLDLRFDGADAATTTTDSSVYAWPVTLTGGAELDTAQKHSGTASLLLNGTGARASVAAPGYNYIGNSLVFYIRPATIADCILVTKADAAGYVYQIGMNAAGKVWFRWAGLNGSPLQMIATALPALTVGTWAKIELQAPLSATRSEARINLYVNDAFGTSTPAIGTITGNDAPITIGADYDGTQAFHGHIDALTMQLNYAL